MHQKLPVGEYRHYTLTIKPTHAHQAEGVVLSLSIEGRADMNMVTMPRDWKEYQTGLCGMNPSIILLMWTMGGRKRRLNTLYRPIRQGLGIYRRKNILILIP